MLRQGCFAGNDGGGDACPLSHTEFDEVEVTRHEQHKQLARALAADKAQLGDALRLQVGYLLIFQAWCQFP